MRKKIFFALFCAISVTLFAQQGRDGSPTISTTVSVNEYTYLTLNANAGNTTITVAASTLNAHGRFSGNLAPGDLIMIIQMQGAALNGAIDATYGNVGLPDDSSWGGVTNYNNCGNYEFAEVSAVPSATTITLDCGLQNNYTAAGKVQIVRVPRYNSLTINSGGTISCDQWDSAIGGVIAIEVETNTIINSGGSINADSAGFRGGLFHSQDSIGWNVSWYSSTFESLGKEKGEGVGGFEWSYTQYGGKECMGAPGNGGGGGNVQNAGGGGGANGGVVANYINGFGNPNVSTADNITAWNLEYSWMSAFTSSGGGRGGYSFSANNKNPLVDGPGNINPAWETDWGGDYRRSVGGRGGRPMDYSTGKIYMGGGGGAGDQNDDCGGMGGKGGGIVYLMSYGTVSGSGTAAIISNGENGFSAQAKSNTGSAYGIDGAGGAGAGGTIIINSVGTISGIGLTTNGGTGGSQVLKNVVGDPEAEGPGGGGGGGYIATSNTGLTETTTGGANGTTNAVAMANFLPNGATIGGGGTTGATITNFHLTAENDTICSGNTATLTATISGTAPGGTTIEWYTTDSGGVAIATGPSYTTPVLTTTTTYYVGSCPGTYRIAVKVVIVGAASVTITPNTTICKGTSTNLTATGGTSYSWLPTTGLSNPAISNPVASPTTTTTYTASITTTCGVITDSVKITVLPIPVPTIIASQNPICAGQPVTITASGGTGYSWSNSATTSAITISPASTSTLTVSVSNGSCAKDTSIVITVNPLPVVGINASVNPVCSGSATTITATGGTTYLWSNTDITSSITVTPPTGTDTYTVGIGNGVCTKDTDIQITVNATPTVTVTPPSATICTSGSVPLTANGATSYTWTPSTGLTCTTCYNPTATPTGTQTYTVVGSSSGCTDTTTVTVTVANTLTAVISDDTNFCAGSSTTLTASGGSTYLWSTGVTSASITVTSAGNYSVVVSSGSCSSDTNVNVHIIPLPTVTISPDTTICSGSTIILTAMGGGTYSWSNTSSSTTSSISVDPTSPTTYTAVVTKNGCSNDASVTVNTTSSLTVNITGAKPICAGDTLTLKTTGGGTYLWSPGGATTDSIRVNPTTGTTYSVTVTNGCSGTNSAFVTVDNPTFALCCDTIIMSGNSAQLTAIGSDHYTWTPITGLNCDTCATVSANPTTTTTYTVTGKDALGCTTFNTITVIVDQPCTTLVIPNVFTPTNPGPDGVNGLFYINTTNLDSWSILIVDRWGKEVFKTNSPNQYWDGNTESGAQAPSGVYYYIINATCQATTDKKEGFVQLIR